MPHGIATTSAGRVPRRPGDLPALPRVQCPAHATAAHKDRATFGTGAPMTTLILVRHGQTDSNVLNLLHGHSDVPLTPLGIAQAHAIAARLGQEPGIAALYTSPLERAHHNAEIIGAVIGHRPIPHPGLMEIHFGDIEGLTWEVAVALHPHLRATGDD